jgi:drug/metabolite transporter (DMT)-like permease
MKAILYGIFYAVSSAGETLAVKALNYNASPPVELPAYTAFLCNQMWILMIPIYWSLEKKPMLEYRFQYLGMGILTFAITLLRNISVNAIPGSVFALLISTSILFNIVLSSVILKKSFNRWHGAAAFACVCSAGIGSLFTYETYVNYKVGIPTAIGAAFFSALSSVWQEMIQPTWDDYNLRVVELTIVASLIASVLIVIYAMISGELFQWQSVLIASTQTPSSLAIVVSMSMLFPLIKLIVRNSKYSIIKNSSAFFFEFVQSSAALLCSLSSILLFNEPWGYAYIISLFLLAISFAMYAYAKKKKVETVKVAELVIQNPLVVVRAWN